MASIKRLIAPKASAEGACILTEMGYRYGVWLVTVIMVCDDCNDTDLATVAVVGVVIIMPSIW